MKHNTAFQISGLPTDPFIPYFRMNDEELARNHARKVVADEKPGLPCRVSLIDAEPGETLILVSFTHHDVPGPYHASGPIYVRETAEPSRYINDLPPAVQTRMMSARAYSAEGSMIASGAAQGAELIVLIQELFTDNAVAYLHLHNAKPGCFSCRVDRM